MAFVQMGVLSAGLGLSAAALLFGAALFKTGDSPRLMIVGLFSLPVIAWLWFIQDRDALGTAAAVTAFLSGVIVSTAIVRRLADGFFFASDEPVAALMATATAFTFPEAPEQEYVNVVDGHAELGVGWVTPGVASVVDSRDRALDLMGWHRISPWSDAPGTDPTCRVTREPLSSPSATLHSMTDPPEGT